MEFTWYYARNGMDRQGPVSETELRNLIDQGQVQPDDLLWREGMAAWTPLRDLTEFRTPSPPTPSTPAPPPTPEKRVAVPSGLSGWMAFNGILIILSGLAYITTCFALPSGVLLVIAGASLMSAQSMLSGLRTVDPTFLPFLQKLRGFFLMTGVATLVAIALTVLFLIVIIGFGAATFATLFEQFTPR
jgi:hypothetical protein